MDGIYYKDGVYVLIDNDTKNDICLYHPSYRQYVDLYGGRVTISKSGGFNNSTLCHLTIDGIRIINMSYHTHIDYLDRLTPSLITSYLNAIELNGVDAFLENYKKSIEFLYGELKELHQKTESQLTIVQEESNVKSLLDDLHKIRKLLLFFLGILFNLNIHMSAALENERVVSVCQSIMDSLA
jgi:hypothetical protein